MALETQYHSFHPALRTSPTRPLLVVLSWWREMGCVVQSWIADVLHTGYRLQYHFSPPQYMGMLETTLASELHTATLATEVTGLLMKGTFSLVVQAALEPLLRRGFVVRCYLDGLHVGGLWPPGEARHVDVLELLAVQLVLLHFQSRLQGRHVLIRSSNTAVCAYLDRRGGSKSPQLHTVASEFLVWSQIHLLSVRPHTSEVSWTWGRIL